MNKFYLIFLTGFCLFTGSIAQAVESSAVPIDKVYEPGKPERILVLYDNPMEEHTVISVLITHGYNVKIEKELNAAIEVLKKQAARAGAHAIIVLPTGYNKNVESVVKKDNIDKIISAKAIRYKHFYY